KLRAGAVMVEAYDRATLRGRLEDDRAQRVAEAGEQKDMRLAEDLLEAEPGEPAEEDHPVAETEPAGIGLAPQPLRPVTDDKKPDLLIADPARHLEAERQRLAV